MAYFKNIDRYGEEQYNAGLWENVTTNPTDTGNDPVGPRWLENTVTGDKFFIDALGRAEKLGSTPFKNLNEFHCDPAGSDSTGDGSQEKPFKTIAKALTSVGQGDQVVVHAGVYTENVTISVPNVAIVGAQSEYGALTHIQGNITVTANGTSVKLADITLDGIVHSGTAPLYLENLSVSTTLSSSTSAYLEVKNSSVQDGAITKSAGTMLIEQSKIDTVNITGTNTVATIRNSYQDLNSTITYDAGTIYNVQNVQGGEIVINAAAIPLETVALAQGLSAEMAKEAESADFMKLGMLRPDLEATPTKVVTWDEVTGRLEVSDLSSIATSSAPEKVEFGTLIPTSATGYTAGDEYFVTDNGTSTGKITAQYIFDGTNWVLRQSALVTTSLTPQHQNTSGTWANAQANSLTNVADDILLSNGNKVKYGKYTFVGHGFTPGANLYLSKTLAGTVTMTAPLDGDVHQKLAFVHDANTIEILVQEAFVQGSTASTTNSNTGISSGLVARGVDVQLDNFKVRVIQGATATQNSLRISTVTGTTTLTAVSNQVITGGGNFVGNSVSLAVSTTPVELQAGWAYVQGGTQLSYFYDPTSGKAYRVTAIYATSNGSSHITIERI